MNNLADLIVYEIEALGGVEEAANFKQLANSLNINWTTLSDSEQIKYINSIIRKSLNPIPHSCGIRNWLEDIDDINEYVTNFINYWGEDYLATGALDTNVSSS